MNYTTYRQLREAGCSPQAALQQMQESPPVRLHWHDDKATWCQDGFLLTARLIPDTCPDLDYLGWYVSHRWEPGARRKDRHSPWIAPACTVKALARELRRLKFGRTQAWEIARRQSLENYRRFLSHGDEWVLCDLEVTAARCDVVLGRVPLGCVESDCDEPYLSSLTLELAEEAIADARFKLDELSRTQAA